MVISPSRLLHDFWDGRLPVKPDEIASKLGIEVRAEFGLEDGASGMIFKEGDKYVIAYDMLEPSVRQRFTIAHELGHYSLNHLSDGEIKFRDTRANFMSNSGRPKEVAANSFAANLLMPEETVHFAVVDMGVSNLSALANMFDVSEAAMRYRLMNLGLFDERVT